MTVTLILSGELLGVCGVANESLPAERSLPKETLRMTPNIPFPRNTESVGPRDATGIVGDVAHALTRSILRFNPKSTIYTKALQRREISRNRRHRQEGRMPQSRRMPTQSRTSSAKLLVWPRRTVLQAPIIEIFESPTENEIRFDSHFRPPVRFPEIRSSAIPSHVFPQIHSSGNAAKNKA